MANIHTRPWAFYNEIDPDAALILRALIADGVIAPGDVDTRSIKEVQPDDLRPYRQCHFFAGGGLWSVAARMAGWDDDRPLWTGSCPCQPFSIAGKQGGTDDARHLWPDFFRLIRAVRPAVVVGEQVAGQAGYGWLDGVRADLAREAYASRGVDIPACAVDAPHIRQRLYWAALADPDRIAGQQIPGGASCDEEAHGRAGRLVCEPHSDHRLAGDDEGAGCALVDAAGERRSERRPEPVVERGRPAASSTDAPVINVGDAAGLGCPKAFGEPRDGTSPDREGAASRVERPYGADSLDVGHAASRGREQGIVAASIARYRNQSAAAHGRNGSWWADHEWIACHDGKARRTQPGVPLLVDGLPGRVGLWRVAGNAISPVLAAEVIGALMDTLDMRDAA